MINELQDAIKLHQSGELNEALKSYLALKENNGTHGDLLHLIGICYAQLKDYSKAIEYFKKALTIHKNACEILSNLGNAYQRIDKIDEAIDCFHQSLKIKPSNAVTHNNLGHLYLKQKKTDLAKSHFNQAILQCHEYPEAHYNLGLIETQSNQFKKAIKHFQNALKHNNQHSSALKMLAQVHHHNNDIQKAITTYLDYLKLQEDPDAMHSLASCYLAVDDEKNALKYYREVLIKDPKHPELHHNLASFFLTQHNYIEAIKHWLSHLDLNPKDYDTLYNLGVCYLYTGKYDESNSYLHEALKHQPNDYNTLVNLGALHLQQQKIKDAIQYYKSASKQNPEDTSIKFIIEAISGDQNGEMPKEYIENLFNQYAHYYDNHMTKVLDYKLPKRVEIILNEYIPRDFKPAMLDLGCGTGLLGPLLNEYTPNLDGIDISSSMIEVAEKLGVYRNLSKFDAVSYLKQNHHYDWIIALELLPYIQEPNELLSACFQSLNDGGYMVISAETHLNDECCVKLSTSARYQYHPKKFENKLQNTGFEIEMSEKINLRKQHSQFVKGYIWLVRKPIVN